MYARHNPAVMDASTAAGYLTWAALALGGTPAGPRRAPRPVGGKDTPA